MLLTHDQDCLQCGKCCEKWGWGQKDVIEDIIPWIMQGRKDILQHVGIRFNDGKQMNGQDISFEDLPHIAGIDYWISIKGWKIRHCPLFFRAEDGTVWCRIHDAKPKVCIRFNPRNEGIRDYAM